jgi:hypothetical protein
MSASQKPTRPALSSSARAGSSSSTATKASISGFPEVGPVAAQAGRHHDVHADWARIDQGRLHGEASVEGQRYTIDM